MGKEAPTTNVFAIETFKTSQLPELASKQSEIDDVIAENPIVEITDGKSLELAKKSRTAVRTLRTGLDKERKMVSGRVKEFILKPIDAEYDALIAGVIEQEDLRQAPIDKWDELKAAEKAEEDRIEAERVENIKGKIDAFYNEWDESFNDMLFEDIEITSKSFEGKGGDFDLASLAEFVPLFVQKKELLSTKLADKVKILTDAENNRLEEARLEAIRLENEKRQLLLDSLNGFQINWENIVFHSDKNTISEVEDKWKNLIDKDYGEYHDNYLEKKKIIKEKILSKIAMINDMERIRLEQEKFAAEKLAFRTEKRVKVLTDLGLDLEADGAYCNEMGVFMTEVEIKEIDDDKFTSLTDEYRNAITPAEVPEEIVDLIGSDPIETPDVIEIHQADFATEMVTDLIISSEDSPLVGEFIIHETEHENIEFPLLGEINYSDLLTKFLDGKRQTNMTAEKFAAWLDEKYQSPTPL